MDSLTHTHTHSHPSYHPPNQNKWRFDIFYPLRLLVDKMSVKNYYLAHFICKVIPCCCPFERDFKLLGRTFHIPPLCKLNPLYDNLVFLRFRALSYLADDCGEDINKYICD
jgi:Mo-dependent nitrogenase C-terminus